MLHFPALLDAAALEAVRTAIADASWIDGDATAGHQSRQVKRNRQLAEDDPATRAAGAAILDALNREAAFVSAALPARIVPPLFNRYEDGEAYGPHIDGAIRPLGAYGRMRTDLAATLFLSPPDNYDGGTLRIRDPSGERRVKLAAGDLVLYPASSVHEVEPVTRGVRLAAFFWIQSIVRDRVCREMLHELDQTVQAVSAAVPDHPALVALTGHYHNLLRRWADP